MNLNKFITGFSAASALAMTLGLSTGASAAPAFTVTPSVLGGPETPFQADQINGIMSSLITFNPIANTTSGGGYIAFNGFGYQERPVGAGTSGLTTNYDLYVTYTFTSNVTGVFGATGEDPLTSLNYQLWGAAYGTTTFTPANANTNTAATAVNGAAVQLGQGSLIDGITGFNSAGGAYVNSSATFDTTAFGATFFSSPNPFYDIAFNSFNNTLPGILRNGDVVSVNQAIGNIDFSEVPEPISLALVGLGLVGVGVTTRRRKS